MTVAGSSVQRAAPQELRIGNHRLCLIGLMDLLEKLPTFDSFSTSIFDLHLVFVLDVKGSLIASQDL